MDVIDVVVDTIDGRVGDGLAQRSTGVTHLLLEYDESVDAAYLTASEKPWHHQVRLDDARGINYAADGSVIGIELLSPRRKGVDLEGLPYRDDAERIVKSVGFRIVMRSRRGTGRRPRAGTPAGS